MQIFDENYNVYGGQQEKRTRGQSLPRKQVLQESHRHSAVDTYYRNLYGNLSRTIADESQALQAQLSQDSAFSEADMDEKSDILKRLYISPQVQEQYAHIRSMRTPTVLPRYKPDTGQKQEQTFEPSVGFIKFKDEWSSPFSFESKSMTNLRFEASGEIVDPDPALDSLETVDQKKIDHDKHGHAKAVKNDRRQVEDTFGVTLKKAKDRSRATTAPQPPKSYGSSHTVKQSRAPETFSGDTFSSESIRRKAPPVPKPRTSHLGGNSGESRPPRAQAKVSNASYVESKSAGQNNVKKSGFDFLDNW